MGQRRYSKAKGNANHVVWTQDQCIPVPYTMSGLVTTDSFAFLRVQGNAVICTGIHVHFRVPPGDENMQIALTLADANGDEVSATQLLLNGVVLGGDKAYQPSILMPSGSLWQMNVAVLAGQDEYLPQDMTVTYQLRYANGQVRTNFWASGEPLVGLGFYDVNGTFVINS